jgi:hypothetical protein
MPGLTLSSVRTTRDVELKEIKVYADAYRSALDTLPSAVAGFKNKVLLAANFLVDDVVKIIDQNKDDLLFLRVYVGINEDGDHALFIAPVDKSKHVIVKDGTFYTTECCGYPPHKLNFIGDPILGL